jgi:hypothetical protein
MKFLFKRSVLIGMGIGIIYFCFFNRTPHGTECQRLKSSDGLYAAERCLLHWVPGDSSEYVGRLFDAKNGKLLAQRIFSTTDPDLFWSPGLFYSSDPNSSDVRDVGPAVVFSIGDPDDGDSSISLPPSSWDRLLAARSRL